MNDKNQMDVDTEKTRKKRERQEIINKFLDKFQGLKEKISEKIEEKKAELAERREYLKAHPEERERLKKEKKERKRAKKVAKKQTRASTSFKETTITNDTLRGENVESGASRRAKERKKEKIKRIIRNIMTIPEIILIVFLAIFLKDKYIEYSKDVHQVLTYKAGEYEYTIKRDQDNIHVEKVLKENCTGSSCTETKLKEYDVNFEGKKMFAIRFYIDIKFHFKGGKKTLTPNDIKTEYGKKSIRSLIHNDEAFLGFKTYTKYEITEYEQMSGYTEKGFKVEPKGEKALLTLALGERGSSGFSIIVNEIHENEGSYIVYIHEQIPTGDNTSYLTVITHPMIQVELEDIPKTVYVYEIDSGDEFKNYDGPYPDEQKETKVIEQTEKEEQIPGSFTGEEDVETTDDSLIERLTKPVKEFFNNLFK